MTKLLLLIVILLNLIFIINSTYSEPTESGSDSYFEQILDYKTPPNCPVRYNYINCKKSKFA